MVGPGVTISPEHASTVEEGAALVAELPGLPRTVARGLIVLSPLTCSLLQHDVGRYDAVGVLVLAGLAGVGSALRRLPVPVPVGTVLLAAAVGVATASEE